MEAGQGPRSTVLLPSGGVGRVQGRVRPFPKRRRHAKTKTSYPDAGRAGGGQPGLAALAAKVPELGAGRANSALPAVPLSLGGAGCGEAVRTSASSSSSRASRRELWRESK